MDGVKEYEKGQAKEQAEEKTKEQENEEASKRASIQANNREREKERERERERGGRERERGEGGHLLLSTYFAQLFCHYTICLSLAYFLNKDRPYRYLQNQSIYLTYIHFIVNKWLLHNDMNCNVISNL